MKRFFLFFVLFLIASFGISPFFHSGLPLTHDGQDHVARIANFYQSLSEGNIVPRWAGNLNWGYGHPILMFLYPLPSYLASLFHFIGFSFIDSVKIIFVISFLASGLTMFLWIRSFLDEKIGIIAAFLYMFAPYRFVDLYVRGALGEHLAFVFAPLVLFFIHRLYKKTSFSDLIFGAFSFSFLILSHNAISLMFIPFIIVYISILIFESKNKKSLFCSFVAILILGFGLTAFFWLPAFFEGKYTHRDILTYGRYRESFSSFNRFIFSKWSFGGAGKLSVEIGKIQWIFGLLGIPTFVFFYKNKIFFLGKILILSLFTFWISIFLMTSQSTFIWEKITILQKFQFTWRLLTLCVFSSSIIGALSLKLFSKNIKLIYICFIIIVLLILNKDYVKANGYITKPDSFFEGVYFGTTDTGESSPIWSVSYMKETPDSRLAVIGGSAKVKDLKRTSTKHVYLVDATTKSQLRENTLYFPGWNVLVDNQKVAIEYQARNNMGVMTFFIPSGAHLVQVEFTKTKLRKIADVISLITILGIFTFYIKNCE